MAEKTRKSYVNSVTGAVRQSSVAMGYPYVELTAKGKVQLDAAATRKAATDAKKTETAQGGEGAST